MRSSAKRKNSLQAVWTEGIKKGETRPTCFCARRHARGHRNSPPDCFYRLRDCPVRASPSPPKRKNSLKAVWTEGIKKGETRPTRFCARRHARGHRNSPLDCFYRLRDCPVRASPSPPKRKNSLKAVFSGGEGETRTPAPVDPTYALSRGASSPT